MTSVPRSRRMWTNSLRRIATKESQIRPPMIVASASRLRADGHARGDGRRRFRLAAPLGFSLREGHEDVLQRRRDGTRLRRGEPRAVKALAKLGLVDIGADDGVHGLTEDGRAEAEWLRLEPTEGLRGLRRHDFDPT